jgi:hypothetical protein
MQRAKPAFPRPIAEYGGRKRREAKARAARAALPGPLVLWSGPIAMLLTLMAAGQS